MIGPPKALGRPRIGLFGMAPDTGNMGVSALCHSFLAAMHERVPDSSFVLFDNGRGLRTETFKVGFRELNVTLCGARGGRRYYRAENLSSLALLSGAGRLGRVNPVLRLIDSCDVVMDVSAGDSFSDIYGQARFRAICQPKGIASNRGKPLLLLPQTYGPFRSQRNATLARRAILASEQAWARDGASFDVLKELLGDAFDPTRHLEGVDMAFGLPVQDPSTPESAEVQRWLQEGRPVVGFNVSGLVWNQTTARDNRFGFRGDYRRIVQDFIEWLLRETDARVLFVPHVHAARGTAESDLDAIEALIEVSRIVRRSLGQRVRIAPDALNEQQSKWVIGQCDWFVGTRMHATIAGLSSGVSTATLVYSDKAAGVFARCHQEDQVIDPRRLSTDEATQQLIACFQRRDTARSRLEPALERVMAKLDQQMGSIARFAAKRI